MVWRNGKKISQIIKDYFYLPFFLLIILSLCQAGEEINEERGSRASMQLPKLEQVLQIQVSGSLSMPGFSVLPGSDKHSRPHSAKTTAIFEAFTVTSQKICWYMIFQSTKTIKNLMFRERFSHFFIFALHFWISQIF